MRQYINSESSSFSKWPKDRMVAVVKHYWLFVQEKMTEDYHWVGGQENISDVTKSDATDDPSWTSLGPLYWVCQKSTQL